jgi:hypothetical protein
LQLEKGQEGNVHRIGGRLRIGSRCRARMVACAFGHGPPITPLYFIAG